MKTTKQFFMGIDVSKPYFDVTLLPVVNHQKQEMQSERELSSPSKILKY